VLHEAATELALGIGPREAHAFDDVGELEHHGEGDAM
jgi:hypothetical protein